MNVVDETTMGGLPSLEGEGQLPSLEDSGQDVLSEEGGAPPGGDEAGIRQGFREKIKEQFTDEQIVALVKGDPDALQETITHMLISEVGMEDDDAAHTAQTIMEEMQVMAQEITGQTLGELSPGANDTPGFAGGEGQTQAGADFTPEGPIPSLEGGV